MNIFEYTDYRTFLKDRFQELKSCRTSFNMSHVARCLKQSPMSVKYVLEQQRHLAETKIDAYIKIFSLTYDEGAYFKELVKFNKAKSLEEKNISFKKMIELRESPLNDYLLRGSELGVFKDWYYTAISELSYTNDFNPDPLSIQKQLKFFVSIENIEKALAYLKKCGFLKNSTSLATKLKLGDEFRTQVYRNYQLRQLEVTKLALDEQDFAEKDFFNITISIDEKRHQALKSKLFELRHELHDFLANTEDSDRVVQINLHSFVVAKTL